MGWQQRGRQVIALATAVAGLSTQVAGAPAVDQRRAIESVGAGTFPQVRVVAGVESEHVGAIAPTEALFWEAEVHHLPPDDVEGARLRACDSAAANTFVCAGYSEAGVGSATGYGAYWTAYVAGAEHTCGVTVSCRSWTFDVTEPGELLRVAMDIDDYDDDTFLELRAPDGTAAARMAPLGAERWVPTPMAGTWTAHLYVLRADHRTVRMRVALDPVDGDYVVTDGHGVPADPAARLEASPNSPVEGGLLPNLRPYPPFNLGFADCQVTEEMDHEAQRCLRFSSGPENVGDGPLDLHVTDVGSLGGQAYQRIHRLDGTTEFVEAGQYEWHSQHSHYHHDAIAGIELLRVDPVERSMELVGTGPKLGFCMGDYVIAEWESFRQEPPATHDELPGHRCSYADPPKPTQQVLSRGWADIYSWYVEGMYAEFADNPDGHYVIRVATDPGNGIHETRDDDNVAYAYFTVAGDEIDVLDRGLGTGPFDPGRVPTDDGRPGAR